MKRGLVGEPGFSRKFAQIQAQIPAGHLSPVTLGQQVGEVTAGATVRLLRGVAGIICRRGRQTRGRREPEDSEGLKLQMKGLGAELEKRADNRCVRNARLHICVIFCQQPGLEFSRRNEFRKSVGELKGQETVVRK